MNGIQYHREQGSQEKMGRNFHKDKVLKSLKVFLRRPQSQRGGDGAEDTAGWRNQDNHSQNNPFLLALSARLVAELQGLLPREAVATLALKREP